MEANEYRDRVENFVREGHFVDPEKVAAVDIYGIEKAEEMWQNGKPSWEERCKLQKYSLLVYLKGGRR